MLRGCDSASFSVTYVAAVVGEEIRFSRSLAAPGTGVTSPGITPPASQSRPKIIPRYGCRLKQLAPAWASRSPRRVAAYTLTRCVAAATKPRRTARHGRAASDKNKRRLPRPAARPKFFGSIAESVGDFRYLLVAERTMERLSPPLFFCVHADQGAHCRPWTPASLSLCSAAGRSCETSCLRDASCPQTSAS